MKYIYGPLKSRRLGFSLGASLTPYKICNFDCIYCQLGKAKDFKTARGEYIKTEDILSELVFWLKDNKEEAQKLDYITISGLGEPTLNIKIGEIINGIKEITAIPLAVITNASLLSDAIVRSELLNSDLIVPSLDAADPKTFALINRPGPGIKIERIINGLIALRKEYRGKIWLEVMLVRGVNDNLRQIKILKDIIDKINPDRIQLNSPLRRTAEDNVLAPESKRLERIKQILGDKCELI